MKTLFRSFLVVSISCFALFAQSCSETAVASPQDKTIKTDVEWTSVNMNIEGMTCAIGCAKTIQHKLNKTEGISDAKVDFESKMAMVTYDKNAMSENDVLALVNNDTYTATVKEGCKPGCEKACCVKAEAKECKPGCEKACCTKAEVKKCSKDAKACAKDSKKCSKDAKACASKDAKKCSSKDSKKCSHASASVDSDAKKCEKECTKPCCAKS